MGEKKPMRLDIEGGGRRTQALGYQEGPIEKEGVTFL